MTITLDELDLTKLDFEPCCEMVHDGKACEKAAVALVKIKCSGCEITSDFLMCQEALDFSIKYGNRHPNCGVAWYITHKALK